MKKFIFTFPLRHPLKNHYQTVIAEDIFQARLRMFERYGKAWASQYTERRAKELGIFDNLRELNPMHCKEVI